MLYSKKEWIYQHTQSISAVKYCWTTLYRALSARIIEELKRVYSPEDLDVALLGLEPGSVVFKFRCVIPKYLCVK